MAYAKQTVTIRNNGNKLKKLKKAKVNPTKLTSLLKKGNKHS